MLIFLTPSRTGLSNKRNMAVGTKTINVLVPLRHGTLITSTSCRRNARYFQGLSSEQFTRLSVSTTPKSHCIT